MSLALKFTSLAIRTLSKPIANFIKGQAREHEGFRQTCVTFAQAIHRVDMRWRIGLLQDAAAYEKQAAKDAAAEAAAKKKASTPTVKTEAQTIADEKAAEKAEKEAHEPAKPRPQPKIRPLSEAKAVETGANFISEFFLFSVAAGLLIFEQFRQRRKASNQRDVVADRLGDLEDSERAARKALVELEREVLRLRAKEADGVAPGRRILPREVYEAQTRDAKQEDEVSKGWLQRIVTFVSSQDPTTAENKQGVEDDGPGPAEKILIESEKAIEEKHKVQAEEMENQSTSGKRKSNSTTLATTATKQSKA